LRLSPHHPFPSSSDEESKGGDCFYEPEYTQSQLNNGRLPADFSWEGIQLLLVMDDVEREAFMSALGHELPVVDNALNASGGHEDRRDEIAEEAGAAVLGKMAEIVSAEMDANGTVILYVVPSLPGDDATIRRGFVGVTRNNMLLGWESPAVWT
jgi:hypothetical protein